MKTLHFTVDPAQLETPGAQANLEQAAAILRAAGRMLHSGFGEDTIFPTDAVYFRRLEQICALLIGTTPNTSLRQ